MWFHQDDEQETKGSREGGGWGLSPAPFFACDLSDRRPVWRTTALLGGLMFVTHSKEFIMNGNDPNAPTQPGQDQEDQIKRRPDEADEDHLDEALEETFPASDPISP